MIQLPQSWNILPLNAYMGQLQLHINQMVENLWDIDIQQVDLTWLSTGTSV